MLQGHFIDGLLDTIFRNPENPIYTIWLYFRGITAPVFFTVSGFIFTYLLVRVPQTGWNNPRVKKGIRRGLQLLIIGYLLRLNIFGLFEGKIYEGFYLVDVLHCIGLSILAIIGVYVLTEKWKKFAFPLVLIAITLVLFLFEPLYKQWSFAFLPSGLANYFTKVNGSVFTIIPWLGYTAFGGFLSLLFTRFKDSKHLYPAAIVLSVISGIELIFFSSDGFIKLYELTGIDLFYIIQLNNYLFIRLGDVFLVFAVFMLLRSLLTNTTILKIGQNTLSIYVIHFVILYGSFTGLGLYRFFYHELNPAVAISGAVAFMVACTALALWYDKNESGVKSRITFAINSIGVQVVIVSRMASLLIRELLVRIKMVLYRLFGFVQN